MKSTKDDKFWENYNIIKGTKKLMESAEKDKTFNKNEIKIIQQILYNSFKGIQNGDYQKVYFKLGKDFGSLKSDMRDLIYNTLNAYLKAYPITIPCNLWETTHSLKNMEIDKEALEKLVESYHPKRAKK